MNRSKSTADAVPEKPSRQRKYLTLLLWVVVICLSFGVYTLLVNALVHNVPDRARVPLHLLAAPDQVVVRIDPAIKAIDPGETFTVDLVIENASDLGAFEFELTYDHTCVQATDVALGSFLGSTGRSIGEVGPTFGAGSVTYGAYSLGTAPPGPDGDGVLATITFQAGMDDCATVLHLQNVTVTDTDGDPSPASTEDGEVTMGAPEVTSIIPDSGYIGQVLEDVILTGERFQEGASVQLTKSGQSPISAPLPAVQSSTRISCTFDLGKAEPGQWTVRVTNLDDQFDELPDGFTVRQLAIYLPIAVKNY